MSYNAVTLGDEDVEWFDAEFDTVKRTLWSDAAFASYVADNGVRAVLETVTRLHRTVANQLIRSAVDDPKSSSWASRAIWLCNRAKSRRNQMRAMFRAQFGPEELALTLAYLDREQPRAVWGSGL